jgi:hypothetical protein
MKERNLYPGFNLGDRSKRKKNENDILTISLKNHAVDTENENCSYNYI